MKKIKIQNGYIKENVAPLQDYAANFINLIKKVIKVKEGKEETEYLERNKNGYNVEDLEKGDIIKAVRFDKINKSALEMYYYVVNKTDSQLTLSEAYSSYYKVKKVLDSLNENIEEFYRIVAKIKDMVDIQTLISGVA